MTARRTGAISGRQNRLTRITSLALPFLMLAFVALMSFSVVGLSGCSRGDESAESQEKSQAGSEQGDEDSSADSTGEVGRDGSSGGDGENSESSAKGGDGAGKGKRSKGGDDGDDDKKVVEALPVDAVPIQSGRIESVVRTSANLEAENQVQILAEAARQVRSLYVEEGDRVSKGQVLLRLENNEQKSALARAQVGFDQAETEFQRQQRLFDQNLAAERAYNDAKHEYERQKIALDDAKRELSYTEVRSTIAGTVTQRLVKVGDQVSVGQHLFDVVDFESLVARVYVPERYISEIASDQPARIRAEAAGTSEYDAKVDRVAPVVDPKSGTVKVTVSVGAQPGLLPGMFVDVDLVTAVHEDAVLVPKRALVYDEDRAFAFKVNGDRAERVAIMPVLSDRDSVEPSEGFAVGDTVVVAGQAGLKDGSLIELVGSGDDRDEDTSS